MRILGVDPGSQRTGYGIIEVQGQRHACVAHGIIKTGRGEFADRICILFRELSEVIAEFRPDEAAMEDVFMSKNAASALKLGQARGALIAACGHAELSVHPYSPTAVKQSVVGFGRAEKDQVQHMISLLLKPAAPLQEDAADALAVAMCHAHHRNSPVVRRATTGTNA
ncbi:MAG TPA: crossover junction endodeoxyribonuclease RuvC [Mariprofundaceae bacterium]|nr:crossover junction endodeoxyribonuclease RuvC [Mariprofundaceae bacterium]